MDGGLRSLEVRPGEGGQRLDLFLAERLQLSRSQTRRLLARGAVSVEGRPVKAAAKGLPVRTGDRVEVAAFTHPEALALVPEPEAPLALLAEGPGWLAVDKPAGMAVHPLEAAETGSLLAAVAARHPELQGVGEGGLRSGVVHRLDLDTSGALLVATREDVWQRLRDAFRAHEVEKHYRAIVLGQLEGEGRLELELVTARHRPARVRAALPGEGARGARPAIMRWRAVEALAGATLVEVRPTTGHLHQIRVGLAHLGHPIAGDRSYGPPADRTAAARHMLHASEVRFEEIAARCEDAPDFSALLERLRGEA